mmetsp:Transcript_20782/g.31779  ORF Transcript_20782/g.31779 Transcript_20782/m.31779 type:complete len:519 (-) Transcript_20782:78-1634(-)
MKKRKELKKKKNDIDCLARRMTKEVLRQTCRSQNGYETPELNDVLYLHYKGYEKIENLEEYVGLKGLWLEANGLKKIQGLEYQTELRCLYLQKNLFKKIEGLAQLKNLRVLDLSDNCLTSLENLRVIPCLETLNIKKNEIGPNVSSIYELVYLEHLSILDISCNKLMDENCLSVFQQMKNLASLTLNGNPFVRTISHFRKNAIIQLKNLSYLDRPIFDDEREIALAWFKGGIQAERLCKEQISQRKKDKNKKELDQFRSWQQKCREQYLERIAMKSHDFAPLKNAQEIQSKAQEQLVLDREAEHQAELLFTKTSLPSPENASPPIHSIEQSTNVSPPPPPPPPPSTTNSIQTNNTAANISSGILEEKSTSSQQQQRKNEFAWTPDLDARLSKYVQHHSFDFDAVASDLQIDAESCRLRWVEIDKNDDEDFQNSNNKMFAQFHPPHQPCFGTSTVGKIPSFDELQRNAFQAPSCVRRPENLPSLADFGDESDDEDTSLFARISFSHEFHREATSNRYVL